MIKKTIVQDECWSCGRPFTLGDAVVEVTISTVVEDEKGLIDHKIMEHGLYERHCLRCAHNDLRGINDDNLDACFPNWKENASYKENWLNDDEA